nr:hypothetical protein CFP56_07578 [Quercus suber]
MGIQCDRSSTVCVVLIARYEGRRTSTAGPEGRILICTNTATAVSNRSNSGRRDLSCQPYATIDGLVQTQWPVHHDLSGSTKRGTRIEARKWSASNVDQEQHATAMWTLSWSASRGVSALHDGRRDSPPAELPRPSKLRCQLQTCREVLQCLHEVTSASVTCSEQWAVELREHLTAFRAVWRPMSTTSTRDVRIDRIECRGGASFSDTTASARR